MKCALVNPPPRRLAEVWDAPDFPNISIAYAAAALRASGVGAVEVLDCKLARQNASQLDAWLRREEPDLLGVTAFTHEIAEAHAVAQRAKAFLPNLVTVVGGVHATVLPRETIREYEAFDYLVSGESEGTLPQLVARLANNEPTTDIPGVWSRQSGDSEPPAPTSPRPTDLDALPLPAWDLFPRAEEYPLLAARGCPYACMFCMNHLGRKVRYRDPILVADEMARTVTDFRPSRMTFYDETFGLNRTRTEALLADIRRRGLQRQVKWYATTRIDVLDRDLLESMKASGCWMVGFGVETGSAEIASQIGKQVDLRKAREMVDICRELGITTQMFFILGHPHENRHTLWESVNQAAILNADIPCFGIMVPYPGTKIHAMAQRGEGGYRLIARGWRDYNKQIGQALELEGISRKELELWQAVGYTWTFVRNRRLTDLVRFVSDYRRAAWALLRRAAMPAFARDRLR